MQIAVQSTGLVTSIGLTTAATCAALRASVANPTPTRFMGIDGEWIMAHQVPLDQPVDGLNRLAVMASMAVSECLEPLPAHLRESIPLVLCLAERERPGRLDGLDDMLFEQVQETLGLRFHSHYSSRIALGRPGALVALEQARRLIHEQDVPHVLIAAADSLLSWETLASLSDQGRLLAEHNSNGFMPSEAAGAILLGRPHTQSSELVCLGVGYGSEPAPVRSGEPLRADGLTTAIKAALRDSGCELHDIDFRITDISGEQYFFREASLAFSRSIRQPKEEFDLWHPADCIGEAGAAAGTALIAIALTACAKSYAKGPRILLHASADGDTRAAAIMAWTGVMS
jgi:3-oxoacyl-[acyl-carrier-protein] synthase-1